MSSTLKWLSILSAGMILVACDSANEDVLENETAEHPRDKATDFDVSHAIHATTREDGSGTRSAFVESVGLEDEEGNDIIDQSLSIQNGTNAVITGVQEDIYGMGYISVGSLSDDVKALEIEGVEPSEETISSGDYSISRKFNLVYGKELSEVAQDFWNFVLSQEGQKVIVDHTLVSIDSNAEPFKGGDVSGVVQINGSTSITPVMEALTEAYNQLNEEVTFDIASTGSSAGITAAIEGTADIGMSSRELTTEEKDKLAGGLS